MSESNPYQPPAVPVVPVPAGALPTGDATGGLIPYKNVPALIAYYCGVFALIPCFPIGIAGFVLGIIGLKRARANPVVKGKVHAWIGIVAGGLFGLVWLATTAFTIALPYLDR